MLRSHLSLRSPILFKGICSNPRIPFSWPMVSFILLLVSASGCATGRPPRTGACLFYPANENWLCADKDDHTIDRPSTPLTCYTLTDWEALMNYMKGAK